MKKRLVFLLAFISFSFLVGWTNWNGNWWAKYLFNKTTMEDENEVYLSIKSKNGQSAGIRLVRIGSGTDWYIKNEGMLRILLGTNDSNISGNGFAFNSSNNFGVGTNNIGGGSQNLVFRSGFAPSSPSANYSRIYAKDVGGTSELFVYDGAGNETQISPHDPQTGEWIFFSKNVKTGRVVKIKMEKLIFDIAKEMSKKTGKKYIEEWYE